MLGMEMYGLFEGILTLVQDAYAQGLLTGFSLGFIAGVVFVTLVLSRK